MKTPTQRQLDRRLLHGDSPLRAVTVKFPNGTEGGFRSQAEYMFGIPSEAMSPAVGDHVIVRVPNGFAVAIAVRVYGTGEVDLEEFTEWMVGTVKGPAIPAYYRDERSAKLLGNKNRERMAEIREVDAAFGRAIGIRNTKRRQSDELALKYGRMMSDPNAVMREANDLLVELRTRRSEYEGAQRTVEALQVRLSELKAA